MSAALSWLLRVQRPAPRGRRRVARTGGLEGPGADRRNAAGRAAAPTNPPVDCRRRAARSISRARGVAAATDEQRRAHTGGDKCGTTDSGRLGEYAATADRCLDRRLAART